jgi:hypothetical protein
MPTVTYLRAGRKVRSSGTIIWKAANGMMKVKPSRADWSAVLLTPQEITAGATKPEIIPRRDVEPPKKPRQPRKKKPAPLPRWKELVNRVRIYEQDHSPNGWPAVTMSFVSELANELEKTQNLFQ